MTKIRTGSSTRTMLRALPLLLPLAVTPTFAAVSLQEYAAMKNTESFRLYLSGVTDGFRQANAELELRRAKKLYCAPANAQLGFDKYTTILEKEVADHATFYTHESPVGSALLFGLMKTYSCASS